jgi:hypothetical protein
MCIMYRHYMLYTIQRRPQSGSLVAPRSGDEVQEGGKREWVGGWGGKEWKKEEGREADYTGCVEGRTKTRARATSHKRTHIQNGR